MSAPRIDENLAIGALGNAVNGENPEEGPMARADGSGRCAPGGFRRELEDRGFVQSFSRKGCPCDNAVMESFSKALKRELPLDRERGARIEPGRKYSSSSSRIAIPGGRIRPSATYRPWNMSGSALISSIPNVLKTVPVHEGGVKDVNGTRVDSGRFSIYAPSRNSTVMSAGRRGIPRKKISLKRR